MLRKNRMMARIKVLIHRIGFDAFKEMVDEELEKVDPVDPTPLMELDQVYKETPPALVAAPSNGQELPEEFLYWKKTNVEPQKQSGYMLVYVTVPQGDIMVEQFPALARHRPEVHRRLRPHHSGAEPCPALGARGSAL